MSAQAERQMGIESHYSSKKDRVFVRSITGHYKLKDELARLRAMPRVRKGSEIKFVDGPQAYSRHYVEPHDGLTQTLHIHLEEYGPGGKSQKHGHVNEAAFYILDGKGYEIHDGVRYDWSAGDVAIVHNNCVHQHFNADPAKPARALVLKTKPMYMFMNMLFQQLVEPRPTEPAPGGKGQAQEDPPSGRHALGDVPAGAAQAPLERADEHAHGDGGRLHADYSAGEPLGQAPASGRGVPVRSGRPRLRPASGLRRGDHRHLPLEASSRGEALGVGGGGRDLHSPEHHSSAFQRERGEAGAADLGDQPDLQVLRAERPGADRGRSGVRSQGRAYARAGGAVPEAPRQGAGIRASSSKRGGRRRRGWHSALWRAWPRIFPCGSRRIPLLRRSTRAQTALRA